MLPLGVQIGKMDAWENNLVIDGKVEDALSSD